MMMNYLAGCLLFVLTCASPVVHAQRYASRLMNIRFESVTPLETIRAENKNGVLLLDLKSGKVEAAVLIKGFLFRKALMQQHFNDSYMESDKFPRAIFIGQFDPGSVSIEKSGKQAVVVNGRLTIHGVEQPHTCTALLEFKDKDCVAITSFHIKPADFSIRIPALVRDNINKELVVELNSGWMKPTN
ncbi:YceI family protein [Flavihumibacter fluminis]|nr:YceI family protein [Flavihumibacter fluminis]